MNLNKHRTPVPKVVAASAAFVLLFVSALLADIRPDPPTQKDLIGTWVGCGYSCLEFYRLELKTNGSGSFVRLDIDATVSVYHIPTWRIEDTTLIVTLAPRRDAEPLRLTSMKTDLRFLKGQIEGESGWKRAVTLFKEEDWEKRRRIAQDAVR